MYENADTAAYMPGTFGVYTLYVIPCGGLKGLIHRQK